MTKSLLDRRSFLIAGTATLASTLANPSQAFAASAQHRLRMTNPRTGETFDRVIHDGRGFLKDAHDEFNWFARDWRETKAVYMDPKAMMIAADVQRKLGGKDMTLLSGYRTPKTNRMLSGTAKHSYHMKGMALDVQVDGVSTGGLFKTAWNIHRGGVGKYSRSHFVHIDSGPVRTWGS